MKRHTRFLLLLLIAMTNTAFTQRPQRPVDSTISGHVFDAALNVPIEYANIVLYSQRDSIQVTGNITDRDGNFQLPGIRLGIYYITIQFIGYHVHTVRNIAIRRGSTEISLGKIPLKQTALALDGVEVVGEKPALIYKIDRKVINVGKHYTAISGTAVDVLENVPSVTVDIEGNVSLRGSSSFTVLLDNRPTVLEPNEILQQIPASTIETIEIITNPSAKYDPDGIAGIINIITKKRELQGIAGIVNLNTGLYERYGGDFLLNYRNPKFNAYFGADFNNRRYPGSSIAESWTSHRDTTSFINSDGDSRRKRISHGLRGGIDLFLTPKDNLGFGFRYGGRGMDGTTELNYNEWTEPGNQNTLYMSTNKWEHGGYFYSMNMDYLHRFAKKGHELSGRANLSKRDGDEESMNELRTMDDVLTSGKRSTEDGPSTRLRFKLDYTLPLRKNDRFEAGYQSRISRSEDISTFSDYIPDSKQYELQPDFSHTTEYNRDIHSLYTIYSGELGRLGYQGGMRGEYTNRFIELIGENESFSIDRWDVFPTAHFSYQLSEGHQMMASYTRRIDRARGWHFEPFQTWMDAYNVREGNPDLKSEYIDSYELGYQKQFGKNIFSLEAYHRVTHNKVERVRSVYDANIMLHSVQNVGTDYTLGSELRFDFDLFKWWNLNLMGNLYDYRVEGVLYGDTFSRSSFNWRARLNNTLKLNESTRIQINGMYNSPSVSSQGRREEFFRTNAAIRKDFLNKDLSVILQVRDIFGTGKRENISEGPDFYHYRKRARKVPIIILTISYRINNYKTERQRDQDRSGIQEDYENGEEFE